MVCVSKFESNNTTAKKSPLSLRMVVEQLSLPTLLTTFPLFSMWYMHSMLRGHVSVCVCVCVRVRVFFSTFQLTACVTCFRLGAEPRLMIGLWPLWCHGALSAGMRKPLRFPCSSWVFPVFCVRWRLFLCGQRSLLVFLSLEPVHLDSELCLTFQQGTGSVLIWCLQREQSFSDSWNVLLAKLLVGSIALCSSSVKHKDFLSFGGRGR